MPSAVRARALSRRSLSTPALDPAPPRFARVPSQREAIKGDVGDEFNLCEIGSRVLAYVKPRLLIAPDSIFRWRWDAISAALVFYMAAVLPYRICFALKWSLGFAVIDLFTDLYFLCDVILNFFTCYFSHDGELINSYPLIAYHYARSWLAADLLASIPFDWFISGVGLNEPTFDADTYQITRGMEAIRLLRLLRVARLFKYLRRYEDKLAFVNSNVFRLMNVMAVMFFFAHWNGCFQCVVAAPRPLGRRACALAPSSTGECPPVLTPHLGCVRAASALSEGTSLPRLRRTGSSTTSTTTARLSSTRTRGWRG